MKGMGIMFLVMILGLAVASAWSIPIVKNSVHAVLDPSFGALMNFQLNVGFILIIVIFTMITTLLQKYLTDQDTLKIIQDEQKIIREEMKTYKADPTKQMELSKKSMELQMKAMPITMKPVIYTTIPFILTFRWFTDYFATISSGKLLGIFNAHGGSWIWAYIILSMILMFPIKKILKVH